MIVVSVDGWVFCDASLAFCWRRVCSLGCCFLMLGRFPHLCGPWGNTSGGVLSTTVPMDWSPMIWLVAAASWGGQLSGFGMQPRYLAEELHLCLRGASMC